MSVDIYIVQTIYIVISTSPISMFTNVPDTVQCRLLIGAANQNGEITEGPYRMEPRIKANNNWLVGHKKKV